MAAVTVVYRVHVGFCSVFGSGELFNVFGTRVLKNRCRLRVLRRLVATRPKMATVVKHLREAKEV